MRISLKVDYALRAMAQLAADDADAAPVKAESVAQAQDIPPKFLLGILNELKRARLVTSQRGADGGYALARKASDISLADVIRALEGSLANIHEASLTQLSYSGPAADLREVWMAVRTSLRHVLEKVTIADLAGHRLPKQVRALADEYKADVRYQT